MSFLLCIYSICCNKLIIKLYYPHSKCGERVTAPWVRICLSAEPTGQNRTVSGQKPTNQRFVGFFIAYKSCSQDNKRT